MENDVQPSGRKVRLSACGEVVSRDTIASMLSVQDRGDPVYVLTAAWIKYGLHPERYSVLRLPTEAMCQLGWGVAAN